MAIALYREGDTHEVDGVKCEIGTFDHRELEQRKKEGWSVSAPKKRGRKKKEEVKEAPVAEEPNDATGES